MKVSGNSASADVKAAEQFWKITSKEQIFGIDETSLSWQWMLERTFTHKEAESILGLKTLRTEQQSCLGALLQLQM